MVNSRQFITKCVTQLALNQAHTLSFSLLLDFPFILVGIIYIWVEGGFKCARKQREEKHPQDALRKFNPTPVADSSFV